MATGYTHKIKEGQTFQEYALTCARAFGALIMMRDDPMDAPIPDEFKPSDYYVKSLKEHNEQLEALNDMDAQDCEREAQKAYEESLAYHNRALKEDAELKVKYQAMLEKSKAYVPPSKDHVEYRNFMIQQIETSIEHDCNFDYHHKTIKDLVKLSGKDWRKAEIKKAKDSIIYDQKEQAKEVERANTRTLWVKQLKESLK